MDTIAGCISVGLIPSGSQHPYGLRRQATGILRILQAQHWDVTVESLINYTLSVLADAGLTVNASANDDLRTFFGSRAAYLLREENVESDIIHAITDNQLGVFHFAVDKAHVLSVKKQMKLLKTRRRRWCVC